jgi:S1-C subfamily serine protease
LLKKSSIDELARALGGLAVYGCLPGSTAQQAGVRYGDILLSVDGHATPTWEAYVVAREHSGDSIHLRIFRDGREFEVDVVLDRSFRHDPLSVAAALGLTESEEERTPSHALN